jgi:tetratricopeptide (TPR) repeat protein
MSAESWKKVRAVLERASELQGAEQDLYVEEATASDPALGREVRELLAAQARSERLEPPDSRRVVRALDADGGEPQRIGPWKLERRIGTGGMGAVWLATRVDGGFEQRAAIKLIKRGMDSEEILARFERERALLASLEHPWIARLYDGGTTPDGRPYLVMELVSGLSLDQYCADTRRSLREKLELFARVCDAVDFAHQQLVVHRDLKPANVLVTADGSPKLLDFGIAKVLTSDEDAASRTTTGQRILTPQYASPEQLRGARLSTRSDVFSLGVMLYEILTGRRPFDETRTPDTEAHPPSHTSRVRALAGDLDTIALKALRVEPERRYSSAAALADDLRRHLAGLAVLARADTWSYRTAKFVRRNRVLVAATGMVILALSAGLAVAWTQYVEARDAGALADARLSSVVRFASTLSNKVTNKLATLEGLLPQREAMLRELCAELEKLQAEAPGHRSLAVELAWARNDLSQVLWQAGLDSLNRVDEARSLLEQATLQFAPWLERESETPEVATAAAALLISHATCEVNARRIAGARDEYFRALKILRTARANPNNAGRTELWSRECNLLNQLISVERELQDREAEQRHSAEYVSLVEDACTRFPEVAAFRYWRGTSLFARGVSANEAGNPAAGRADLEEAARLLEELHAADPTHSVYRRALAPAYYHLSNSLLMGGENELAAKAAMHAWEEFEATLAIDPTNGTLRDMILQFAYTAGSTARLAQDFPSALRALQRAYDACLERMARHPEHVSLALTRATLGTELAAALAELGEPAKALELAAESVEIGLSIQDHEESGDGWNYGMSLSFSNQAECLIAASREAGTTTSEKRARLNQALEALKEAEALLLEADRLGQVGGDERTHFDHVSKLTNSVQASLAALPME